MPKAKETGAASAPAKTTAGRRSYRSYGKIKPAPGKSKAEPKPIKVSFLGGLNEVGKNMTLFEYGEDMFLVDFEVARVDDSAALAADSESECVGYGMVDMDSLNGKAAEGYHIAWLDDIE